MEEIFVTLFEEINDTQSFEDSLERNFQAIQDFYNAPHQTQIIHKEEIERFILLKNRAISGCSFHSFESRSFLLILLDLCERFALYGSIPRIVRLIQKNDISINKRMFAALKYLYPSPSSNEELVERFNVICSLINEAIADEEDDESKSLVTFLNYYAHVVYNTNVIYATNVKNKFIEALSSTEYPWLEQIKDVAELDVTSPESVYTVIENKIDSITSRLNQQNTESIFDECLMEEGTEYCNELTSVSNRFLSVRQISVNHADGFLTGRGVSLLETEAEMFEYIKRFGRMHYAKLLSSFESTFPQEFDTPVNIIDWGCGQGLASMTFIEKYGAACVSSITLIEPSEIVIKRAALHCRKFAPNASIRTICKKLDDVNACDIRTINEDTTIHLFSNILDIDDYNTSHLFNVVDNILTHINFFVCVSPYIDDIKSARLSSFMRHYEHYDTFSIYHDKENTKQGNFWLCNNSFQRSSFSHGTSNACRDYDSMGCQNKWTRVLKVFSV